MKEITILILILLSVGCSDFTVNINLPEKKSDCIGCLQIDPLTGGPFEPLPPLPLGFPSIDLPLGTNGIGSVPSVQVDPETGLPLKAEPTKGGLPQ